MSDRASKLKVEEALGIELSRSDFNRLKEAKDKEPILTEFLEAKAVLTVDVAKSLLDDGASQIEIQDRALDLMEKHESELKNMLQFYGK